MKQPNTLVKSAAALSSVLLVGAFVGYRAGGFDWFMQTSAGPADSASNLSLQGNRTDAVQSGETALQPATSEQPASNTSELAPVLMSGSKSFTFVNAPHVLKDALPPPPSSSQPSKPAP
jgi:hypothetical protein